VNKQTNCVKTLPPPTCGGDNNKTTTTQNYKSSRTVEHKATNLQTNWQCHKIWWYNLTPAVRDVFTRQLCNTCILRDGVGFL